MASTGQARLQRAQAVHLTSDQLNSSCPPKLFWVRPTASAGITATFLFSFFANLKLLRGG